MAKLTRESSLLVSAVTALRCIFVLMRFLKRVLSVLAAVFVLAIVVVVGEARRSEGELTERLQEVHDAMRNDLDQHRDAFLADQSLASHWLLERRTGGGDASAVLSKRVRWSGGSEATDALLTGVPPELDEQYRRWADQWPAHIDSVDFAGVDVSWLQGLDAFDHWDLATHAPTSPGPWNRRTEPTPRFTDLSTAAKLHLARALKEGDARSAAQDVRALARLCASTETLVGEMMGLALVPVLMQAREHAVTHGHDLAGWPEEDDDTRMRLRRAMFAAPHALSLFEVDREIEDKVIVGRCAGLAEGLATAHDMRKLLEDKLADRYARLGALLAGSSCRLTQMKRAWQTREGELPLDATLFTAMSSVGSEQASEPQTRLRLIPSFVFRLPHVKEAIGLTLLLVAQPAWMQRYDEALPP